MGQTEKRLLWHPRHENTFIVGGNSQITLYEWAAEFPEIRHVTSHHDLNFMKCFAWSPDPSFDDLIAVGMSTGKVDLLRIEAGRQAQKKNVLTGGPTASLPVRNSRSCNALAFSTTNPNCLAVGFDKVRGDPSLVIWDITTLVPTLKVPSASPTDATLPTSHPRLPSASRAENSARIDPRVIQQHAPTEMVSSLAFLPSSTNQFLAGISHRWLRLFDLNTPSIPAVNVASKVQGIATDPFDSHRIASFGDATVSIWDTRKFVQPIMVISERDALADGARIRPGSGYANIEFSSTRRGCLATLEKDASYVRFWDIAESRVNVMEGSVIGGGGSSDGETNRSSRESSRAMKRSWAPNLHWPTGGENKQTFQPQQRSGSPKEKDLSSSLELSSAQQTFVLADTRRTKYFSRPIASFALLPNSTRDSPHPLTSNVMVVNKEGDLELYAIHDSSKQLAWSTKGDLAIGAGLGLKVLEGYDEDENLYENRSESDEGDHASMLNHNVRNASGVRGGGSRSRSPISRSTSRGRKRADPATGHLIPPLPVIPTAAAASPPLFGRGDEDGFPALPGPGSEPVGRLSATGPTGLSATRPSSMRSPGKKSAHTAERSGGKRRSVSRTDTLPADDDLPEEDDHGFRYDMGSIPRKTDASAVIKRGETKSRSRDRRTRVRARTKRSGVVRVLQEDISMIMRRRVKAGYGLSQVQLNIAVTQNNPRSSDGLTETLSELWAWLYHSHEVLSVPTPRLHGYDFSFQGLLGIWEGFAPIPLASQQQVTPIDDTPIAIQRSVLLDIPSNGTQLHPNFAHGYTHAHSASTESTSTTASTGTTASSTTPASNFVPNSSNHSKRRSRSPADDLHGNWPAALAALAARRGADRSSWKPTVPTFKLMQRQIALQVVGWSLRDDELTAAIKRWEKEGQLARAACWLVFTKRYGKAVELLMRSDDETHQMMSGTVAALAPLMSATGSAKGLELRELYGRLIIRLNDPYFRMLLTHLSTNEWAEVLEEEVIPFRERLAIAFQFLDDKALTSYLRRATEQACEHGSIEGLIVTGLTPTGMRVIQSYLDFSGDVQTAAILSSYVVPQRFKDKRVARWLEAYRDLLDGFKLHHLRVGFDIERGQILHEAMQNGDFVVTEEWAPSQLLIRCHYCNKPVNGTGTGMPLAELHHHKGRPTQCSNCNRELPRCSVCLMTLSIDNDGAREVDLGLAHNKDTYEDAIVICQTCRHGGHAVHIVEWFLGDDDRRIPPHQICPVADCSCRCAEEL